MLAKRLTGARAVVKLISTLVFHCRESEKAPSKYAVLRHFKGRDGGPLALNPKQQQWETGTTRGTSTRVRLQCAGE